MGNGSRGLQREWRCMELFPVRARALTRVSLGRRWNRRIQRPASEDLFCAGAVEWARSVLEGAAFRVDESAGKSRRRRQRILLLSGCDADRLDRKSTRLNSSHTV